MKKYIFGLGVILCFVASAVWAQTLTVKMYRVAKKGEGAFVGAIILKNTPQGLLLTPHLTGLKPGLHGFHLHVNPSCAEFGAAAGGHFDPMQTGKHLGPYSSKGHLGDLPALCINQDGEDNLPVLAPRLTLATVKGHALMIHEGADNYSDHPQKLGGGAARMVCGVIP